MAPGRARDERKEQQWRRWIGEWRASGLSVRAFCERRGLIDNNVAEREMKRIAIDRKNWLAVGSPRGGQTAAMQFSFMSTCQRFGVEPGRYLRDVLVVCQV